MRDGAVPVARISGLATPHARLALLYVVGWSGGQTLLLRGSFHAPWLLLCALAFTALAAVLLTSLTDDPLPLRAAVPVALLPVATAATLLPQLDPLRPDLAWLLQIGCYLGGLLVVRGRAALAIGAGLVALLLVLVWAHAWRANGAQVMALIALPIGAYAVGVLWCRLLATSVRAMRSHGTAEAHAALAEAASREAAAQVAGEMRAIAAEAAPLLDRIAAGGTLTAEERTEARVLEARLRDRIRARALAQPPLVDACDRARRAGTDVLLLDDSPAPLTLPTPVLQRIADLVGPLAGGRVAVRVLPPGREAMVTVLIERGAAVRSESVGVATATAGSPGPDPGD
jgi:hypothetical protein